MIDTLIHASDKCNKGLILLGFFVGQGAMHVNVYGNEVYNIYIYNRT